MVEIYLIAKASSHPIAEIYLIGNPRSNLRSNPRDEIYTIANSSSNTIFEIFLIANPRS